MRTFANRTIKKKSSHRKYRGIFRSALIDSDSESPSDPIMNFPFPRRKNRKNGNRRRCIRNVDPKYCFIAPQTIQECCFTSGYGLKHSIIVLEDETCNQSDNPPLEKGGWNIYSYWKRHNARAMQLFQFNPPSCEHQGKKIKRNKKGKNRKRNRRPHSSSIHQHPQMWPKSPIPGLFLPSSFSISPPLSVNASLLLFHHHLSTKREICFFCWQRKENETKKKHNAHTNRQRNTMKKCDLRCLTPCKPKISRTVRK